MRILLTDLHFSVSNISSTRISWQQQGHFVVREPEGFDGGMGSSFLLFSIVTGVFIVPWASLLPGEFLVDFSGNEAALYSAAVDPTSVLVRS